MRAPWVAQIFQQPDETPILKATFEIRRSMSSASAENPPSPTYAGCMHAVPSHPDSGNLTFKTFLDLLDDEAPEVHAIQRILARLEAEGLSEKALGTLRQRRPRSASQRDGWNRLRPGLEAAVEKTRALRMQRWQMDPGRRTLRFCFEVQPPASELNPSALLHALVQTFTEAGLPLAMGLEKVPRPVVSLGPPLPLGAQGAQEWVDCGLREPSPVPAREWPARLASHCPAGLRILEGCLVPNHGSSLLELARQARWQWTCPDALLDLAQTRLDAFLSASSFEIEKTGKVEGRKGVKRIEVRSSILDMAWRENLLTFTMPIQPGEVPSPPKLLAGILGVDPGQIKDLTRLEVILGEDPRLEDAHKYETKLHNIYEDAVLLESDGPIQLVEDDDELLLDR